MEQFDSRYFRGQGKLFVGSRTAAGEPDGLVFVGDLSSVDMTPDISRQQVIENVTGQAGVGSSWIEQSAFTLSIVMRSIKPEHLAVALQGANTAKASASVTGEAHTAKLGKFSRLAHTNVSAVTVSGSGGTPTYVADTDYKVHAAAGLIEWLSGGTVTEDTAAEIDYTYADQHHVASAPNNEAKYLVFAGQNSADSDKQTRVEVYKCKLDPGVFSLITSGAAEGTINGVVEQDALRTAGDQFFTWKTED